LISGNDRIGGVLPTGQLPNEGMAFILQRELAEVYLLLDYLSGRSDKNLSTAFNGAGLPPTAVASEAGNPKPPENAAGAASGGQPAAGANGGGMTNLSQQWISKICEIKWPPDEKKSRPDLAAQASTLLIAKDHLNSAAQPANGESIAFSVLVAGDDEYKVERHSRTKRSRTRVRLSPPSSNEGEDSEPPKEASEIDVPSRISLARQAYPGLIATAASFRRWITIINLFLLVWLVVTCMLSWDIAVGHSLLQRLETIDTSRQALAKRLADVRTEEPKQKETKQAGLLLPAPGSAPQTFCEPYVRNPASTRDPVPEQYKDVDSRQIYCDLAENRYQFRVAHQNLAEWLVPWHLPWHWFRKAANWICKGPCLGDESTAPANSVANSQWAAALVEVLAAAVLPFCYGFLGAGAAVVRNIWAKMRDSQLAPRDLRLAFGQLALGAVIGACIGLFVTSPSSSAQAGATLFTGSVALSASALSFIAGFGVEGIFVALERLIRRIFDIKEGQPAA
jgi:hypothetical protein